ncbi:ATP-dependent RNA helicase DbpA [Halioxenophilus aromaticivorans]|uniref:ATP-dependent RNA helicase DbpA n=1 Tax=Halioxenophilus aromaticivorans TaxID=1306992 RepID=A0AAV3U0T6_9ALTE
MTQALFKTLALRPELLSTLKELGYGSMTPIQAQSLPETLQGRDLIAQAKTGSGKTAAFALGVLNKLQVDRFRVQTLVLCPTRELADQVATEVRKLARGIHNIKVLTLCGGQPFGPQIGSLEHGAHIVVGTPGRILEHLTKGNLTLKDVHQLVLDEADRMLDMGFQPALDAIVEQAPTQRQTLLFSATYPPEIDAIAARYLSNPVSVTVAETHDSSSIEQRYYHCDNNDARFTALETLLLAEEPTSAMVFATTKREVQQICDDLRNRDFSVASLHGDLEQKQRDQTLIQFANKSVTILIATDVAARGLDIDNVDLVINYQLAHDTDVHVHRVGRTGRAGAMGLACSLFTDKDRIKIEKLEDLNGEPITAATLPRPSSSTPARPQMATLLIDGGKKDKLRPGDIVGALTKDGTLSANQIGKIHVTATKAFVAVELKLGKTALNKLTEGRLKGRNFRARLLRS